MDMRGQSGKVGSIRRGDQRISGQRFACVTIYRGNFGVPPRTSENGDGAHR